VNFEVSLFQNFRSI